MMVSDRSRLSRESKCRRKESARTVSWYRANHMAARRSSLSNASAGGGSMTLLSESSALRTFNPRGSIILATRPLYAQHSSILVSSMKILLRIICAWSASAS